MPNQIREEFEAAIRRDLPRANLNQCDVPGSLRLGQYVDECIQHAWWGWESSRAALVVELPDAFDKRDVQGLDYDKTVAAIEAADARVKS